MRDDSSRRRAISSRNPQAPPSSGPPRIPGGVFAWSAAAALIVHAVLLFGSTDLYGGADLVPHLRLMQQMDAQPGLYNVYAPAFHVFGALLLPWASEATAVKLFTLGSAALLIGGFRLFQRAADLPDVSASLFAWAPYAFALSWCLPKVEAAGYGLAFAGLGALLTNRHRWLVAALAGTFFIHTASALFFGLCGGVLALVRRDARAMLALAVATVLASPLFISHLMAGCNAAQALLFSPGDYLRTTGGWTSFDHTHTIIVLAGPIAVACAAAGAPRLWREHREIAILAGVVTFFYLNEVWLAPFGARTTLNLMRGLTVLAFPVAAAAGVFAATRPRWTAAILAACIVWSLGSLFFALPDACHRVVVDPEQAEQLVVDRCTFRWTIRRDH